LEPTGGLHFVGAVAEISVIDLMLGADNALVIAMCCASLPPVHVRKAVVLGTAGAIVLRVLLTTIAGLLFQIPYLKILAAALLAAIAIRLIVTNDRSDFWFKQAARPGEAATASEAVPGMSRAAWSAVAIFIAADLIMSLDNIVALAAVAQGNVWLLIFGLLLSIPLLVFGGLIIVGLLRRHRGLVVLGGVALGWIAGQIAVSDPVLAGWAQTEAPALPVVLPALGAVLVFWESRILLRARRRGKPFRALKPAAATALRPAQPTATINPTIMAGRSE